MPFVVLAWLLVPWLLDVWLTFVIARSLAVNVWLFFAVSALVGMVLMVREWQRLQAQWRALRQMEGSPWQLFASARRALAAFLLILPGLGSDVAGLLLLCWRGNGSAPGDAQRYGPTPTSAPGRREPCPQERREGGSTDAIEGEYRREE